MPGLGKKGGGLRPRKTPEEQELKRKRSESYQFESELAEKELYLSSLRTELLPFELRYLDSVAARYARLDEIEAQIAEREALDRPGNPEAQQAARTAREKANRSKPFVDQQPAEPDEPSSPAVLKSLYREVAKRVHPDLSADPADRGMRQRLMADANRAYERGDEARLRTVLEEYAFSPDTVKGEGTAAELVRMIRKVALIKGRLSEIEKEIRETVFSDLFQLKVRADEAARQGRDLLEEMAAAVESQIAEAGEKLMRLSVESIAPSQRAEAETPPMESAPASPPEAREGALAAAERAPAEN